MRRMLLALALLAPLPAAPGVRAQQKGLTVGVQTWTLRKMSFEQVVEFAVRNGVKNLQMFDAHLDPAAPAEETRRKKRILDENGLVCYTFGVAKTSTDAGANRRLFEFAKLMGVRLIVVEPPDFKILDDLERLAKEYDIRVAIHNHGVRTLYGNPLVLKNLLKYRDRRVGVCLDVGWVTSAGFDAEKVFREYEGRVFDIHLKDVKVSCAGGRETITNVFIGEGEANLKGLLRALREANYAGVLAIETDAELKDPTEFVRGAVKFVGENNP
jgi:sugar phosphate isomerase/epimerase